MFKRQAAFLLFILALLIVPAAFAHAQAGTPPPDTPTPTATPVPLWPPSFQETGDWFVAAIPAHGWKLLLAFVVVAIVWVVLNSIKGVGGALEDVSKEAATKVWDKAEAIDALSETTHAYLEKVADDYARFNFRGLEAVGRGIKVPEFEQAYITLRMRLEAERESEAERFGARRGKGGEPATELLAGRLSAHEAEPLDLAGAIQHSPTLAVVGAAGSGKSTLLQWAGLAIARARLGQKLSDEQRQFVRALGGRPLTPVFIALRDFNAFCKKHNHHRTPGTLLTFLAAHFAEQYPSLKLPANFFEEQLKQGCLLMFDGVDEVDPADRARVREAMEGFVHNYGAERNRYLVSSRSTAYEGTTALANFHRCDVQPLTPDQRDALIGYWCRAAYPPDEAERESHNLQSRIQTSDPRVRALAVTPLMVSIFAVVHYGGRALPRQRAELYENAIHILLTEPHHGGEAAANLRAWGQLSPETRRDRMARVAYELHTLNRDALPEAELVELIWPTFGSERKTAEQAATDFIRLVAHRGGLLEEDDGQYGFFTHRTFREFLAGRYLAQELEDEWPARLLERLGDDQWEEVTRLAAGFLAYANAKKADKFIRALMQAGLTDDDRAHALARAGRCLADFPPDRIIPDTQRELADTMRDWLIFKAPRPKVGPTLRRPLGLALAALGDPRFLPSPVRGGGAGGGGVILPKMITIPAGNFLMGTSEVDEIKLKDQNAESWDDEKPQHPVYISDFAIGQYPLTNIEFRYFVEGAKGYDNKNYWSDEGWRWRQGQLEADLSIYDEATRKNVENWLKRRPKEKRHQPFFWEDPQWNADNQPVVGITWYEAEAYCGWLRALTGQNYCLPTEAQWEKAARTPPPAPPLAESTPGEGSDSPSPDHALAKRVGGGGWGVGLWPWGDVWDKDKCNSSESEFNATTPVGMYPDGASPSGALDMAGNVWEWCMDWYADDVYQKRNGQEVLDPIGPTTGNARVVRGGSFIDSRRYARAAYRLRNVPPYFYYNLGGRVVLFPLK